MTHNVEHVLSKYGEF